MREDMHTATLNREFRSRLNQLCPELVRGTEGTGSRSLALAREPLHDGKRPCCLAHLT